MNAAVVPRESTGLRQDALGPGFIVFFVISAAGPRAFERLGCSKR